MIIVCLVLLGLALGSFVNALVWRLHKQAELTDGPAAKIGRDKGLTIETLSVTRGRSMCTDCHHILAAKDLVPLVSWLTLRGKCRYCRAPISWQYPVVEASTALLFVASYLAWPAGFHAGGIFDFTVWLLSVTAFMSLTIYDLKWFLLPDRIVFPLIGLTVMKLVIDVVFFGGGLHQVLETGLAVSCTAGLFFLLYAVSKHRWIGFGDVKLAMALGILAGRPDAAVLLVFTSAMLGTLASLPLLFKRRVSMGSQIPYGPFLMAATYLVVLFGAPILGWYGHLLLNH